MVAESTIYTAIVATLIVLAAAELGLSLSIYRRFQLPFARTYFLYLICTLSFGIFAYIGQNLVWRVIASLAEDPGVFKRVALFFPFLAFPILIIAGYYFVRLFAELVDRPLPRHFASIYFGVQLAGYAVFGTVLFRAESLGPDRLDLYAQWAQFVFAGIQVVVLALAVVLALTGVYRIKIAVRRRSIRQFVTMYILLDATRIVLSLFVEDRLAVAIPYAFLYFGGDLPPLLYLKSILQRHWHRQHDGCLDEAWVSILTRYDITPRQAEIVTLICQGRSNQEIAEELFISLPTVKSHVHAIFAKTGVNNRVQLTNLFRPT